MTEYQTHEEERLAFRELFSAETRFDNVFTGYVATRNVDRGDDAKKRNTLHSILIVSTLIVSLVNLVVTGFALPSIIGSILSVTAALFIVPLWFSIVGVTVWLLHRYGTFIFSALTIIFIVLTVVAEAGSKTAPFIFAAASTIGLLISLFVAGIKRLLTNRHVEVPEDAEEYTKADEIRERLPEILVDYYAPELRFRGTPPRRAEFKTNEEFIRAEEIHRGRMMQERLEYASTFVKSVQDDPVRENVVIITLRTALGSTDEVLIKKASMLNSALETFGIEEHDYDGSAGTVVLRANIAPVPSDIQRLAATTIERDFFATNPSTSVFSTPLAVDANGEVYKLPTHHTLIAGLTGSGKGSPIQGLIRAQADFVRQGLVRNWAIDPKRAELKPYANSALFHRVAFDVEESASLIHEFHGELKRVQQLSARSSDVTVDSPVNMLFIDEAFSFLQNPAIMKHKNPDTEATVAAEFLEIMAQGRSDNFFVVGATQEVTKEALGMYRTNFANKIALRLNTPLNVDTILGDSAVEGGAVAHRIPPANSDNKYASAGIGNVRGETGDIRLVRFAYTSDEDIDNLVASFPARESKELPQQHRKTPQRQGSSSTQDALNALKDFDYED